MSRIAGHAPGYSVVTLRSSPVSGSFTLAVCTAIPATAGLASTSRRVLAVHAAPVTVRTRRSRRSRATAFSEIPRSRMSAAAFWISCASPGLMISVLRCFGALGSCSYP